MPKLTPILLSILCSLLFCTQQALAKGPALFEPTFIYSNGGKSSAGKAWLAKVSGKTLAVTALHLLGPDGGIPKQIPASRVASWVRQVDFYSSGKKYFSSTKALSKTGYVTNGPDFRGDVVFFQAPDKMAESAFTLAAKEPKLKDPVWLYTRVQGGRVTAYPGIVINTSSIMLQIRLRRPIKVQATSGSPILDAKGKVIGLACAARPEKGIFMCNPSTAILKRIKSDLKK